MNNEKLSKDIQNLLCSICNYYRDGMCLRMNIEVDAFDGCLDGEEKDELLL